jgi:hypothetical protein
VVSWVLTGGDSCVGLVEIGLRGVSHSELRGLVGE